MKPENQDRENSFVPLDTLDPADLPQGVDRRAFMMRSALVGAMSVIAGCSPSTPQQTAAPAAAPPAPPQPAASALSPDLEVVKKSKGPVMTTLDEF